MKLSFNAFAAMGRKVLYGVVFLALSMPMAQSCLTLPEDAPADDVWSDLGDPAKGIAAVLHLGRWGYADKWGRMSIAPQFAEAMPFSEGRAAVRLTDRWGFVDHQGKYTIRPTYEEVQSYEEGLAPVRTKKGWGFASLSGKLIIKDEYDGAGPFSHGLAAVRIGTRWGYIEKDGRPRIAFEFGAAGKYSENLAPVATMDTDNEWGYIDHRGKYIIEPAFDYARSFSGGLAAVLVDGKWGFIDKGGRLVVNPRFDAVGNFADEVAPVKEQGLWGLIDVDGNFVRRPHWKELGSFNDGLARAATPEGRVALINNLGFEASLKADLNKGKAAAAQAAAAQASAGPGADTIELRVEVKDHLTGKPVQGFSFTHALGSYGDQVLVSSGESGPDGILSLRIGAELYGKTKELIGGGDAFFPCVMDVSDHRPSGFSVRVLPLSAELPKLDQVLFTEDQAKEGSNVLLQQEEYEFGKPGKVGVRFDVHSGGFKIKKYFLQQGTKRVESDSPAFSLEPGKAFSVGDPIHAGVVTDYQNMPVALQTLVKLRKNPALEKPIDMPVSPGVQLVKDIPFAGGQSGELRIPFLKFKVEYGEDKVTIFIGVSEEWTKHAGGSWQGSYKNFIKESMEGMHRLSELMEMYRTQNFVPHQEGAGVFKSSVGALGYVEMGYGAKGLEVLAGGLMVFGEFGYEFTQTMMVGFIPVYASLGIGGEVAVQFSSDGKPQAFSDFFSDVTVKVTPYVDVEGGVGIKGLLSIGLALHGAIEMEFQVLKKHFGGQMTLDFFLRLRALFVFTKEIRLAGKKWPVGHHAASGLDEPPPWTLPEGFADAPLEMESKEYLAAGSTWLGAEPPPAAPIGGDPLTIQALKTNIIPGSEPLLYDFAGTQMLFWVDNAPGRARADMAALMFSRRGKDGSWSEPKIVGDDGTADYEFAVQEHRGKLYVAWQNTSKVYGGASAAMEDMVKHSHVVAAKYDPGNNSFGTPKWINGIVEGFYYGRPRMASDGKTLALTFVSNNMGDYYLSRGISLLTQIRMTGDDWPNALDSLYFTDKAFIGYDIMVQNGLAYAAVNQDEDGNLQTIDDRTVLIAHKEDRAKSFTIDKVSPPGLHGNPRFVPWKGKNSLFFYEGDAKTGTGNIVYYPDALSRGWPSGRRSVYGKSQAMGEDFSLLNGPRNALGILSVDQNVKLRSAPAMTVYDPSRDAWGLPARLVSEKPQNEKRAEVPRGLWSSEDRIDIVYRSLPASAEGKADDPPPTTMELLSTYAAPDLAVDPGAIYRYYGPQKGGDLITINVAVENRGLATAKGVGLEIRSKDFQTHSGYFSFHKDTVLHPGEKAVLPVQYRLPPSTEGAYNLYFVASHLSGPELNNGNNGAPVKFAEPDFGLGTVELYRRGYERHFKVPIQNRSPVRVRNVRLTLYDDLDKSQALKVIEYPFLEPYQEVWAEHTVKLDELRWPKAQKRLLFELTSDDVRKPGDHSTPFVVIDPLSYPAFSLSIFDARTAGAGYLWVSAAASNNHPKDERGDLLVEILNNRGETERSYTQSLAVKSGATAVVSRSFAVKEAPSSYSVRVSMKNTALLLPGSPEAGDRTELGGEPVPVEAHVSENQR